MSGPRARRWTIAATIAVVTACDRLPGRTPAQIETAHPVLDSAAVRAVPPEPQFVRTLLAVPVSGFSGPGGVPFEVGIRTAGADVRLHRQIGMRTFALPLRLSARGLSQYPCATCHQGATITGRGDEPRHANIRPEHPQFNEGACVTCHQTGAVERLTLVGGATTTFDHSYQLCAQCHFAQVNAWAAGGHGKRQVGWGGRRVVMACTDCHDPHRPGVEPRLPFAGPRIRQSSGASH